MEDWEQVVDLLGKLPGDCSFEDLVDCLMRDRGWDRARATKAIETAIEKGGLVLTDGRLTLKAAKPPRPGKSRLKP